jgi:L-histidine N-alpha-methyltransferase
MLRDVANGMSARPRTLPSKYFYDQRGSELFERITQLPEYYLTNAERTLLTRAAPEIARETGAATLVELGAGSAAKTRLLLDAMRAHRPGGITYVPVDVSESFLDDMAARLSAQYPDARIEPVAADFTSAFTIPAHPAPTLYAFLGSTIGNFEMDAAIALLRGARAHMKPEDFFLLGVDLRKDVTVLERAYNDDAGVTAEFNRNILRVVNDTLGADFGVDAFTHRAIYNGTDHRIEMWLVAEHPQHVHVPGMPDVVFARGDTIRTEVSHKYDRATIERMLREGGMQLCHWITDPDALFALALAEPVPA